MKRKIILFLSVMLLGLPLLADEGMWMVGTSKQAVQKMAKAVVSIDFMGTGSFVSDDGLVITNHHVAYADVFALGTKEHNWLEDGFWARERSEEMPVPGRKVQLLKETLDVTAEADSLISSGRVKPGLMMMRKLSWILEKKYEERRDSWQC